MLSKGNSKLRLTMRQKGEKDFRARGWHSAAIHGPSEVRWGSLAGERTTVNSARRSERERGSCWQLSEFVKQDKDRTCLINLSTVENNS